MCHNVFCFNLVFICILFYTTIITSFIHSSYLLLFVSPINLILFIPGGGEFKFLRGFNPYIVNSVHHFRSRELGSAVENFLIQERMRNQVRIHLYIDQENTFPASLLYEHNYNNIILIFNYRLFLFLQATADYLLANSPLSKKSTSTASSTSSSTSSEDD
jgi:Peptidogalycan biosysnthesis/recognition